MEIPHPSRTCSVSRREFLPDEMFYSVLTEENGQFCRKDIAAEHWTGQPENFFGWWKSFAGHVAGHPPNRQVPGEALLTLFEQLVMQPDDAEMLYILTLLLLRRKLLRYEGETEEQGGRWLEVYSLHTDQTYKIPAAIPDSERLEWIQQQFAALTAALSSPNGII